MRHGVRKTCLSAAMLSLLGMHAALLGSMATRLSPTFDEAAYLPAGISHWRFGRFELYRACPHFVRTVAALPVLATDAATDWDRYEPTTGGMPEFAVGQDFVHANGVKTFGYMALARWACIPFSLLGGYVCFRWARELYGEPAGLVALALWCFSPAILGFGALITADVATASLGALAFYLYARWLKSPTWAGAASHGAVFGLLLLTRSNAVLLFLFWPLLWAVWQALGKHAGGRRRLVHETGQLFLSLVVGLYVLNVGYLFDGSFQRLGDFEFASRALAGSGGGSNRFEGTWFGEVAVPLPKDYVLGADTLKRNFESNSKLAYLGGEFQRTGWWYYYLYGLAVKVPVGTWLLLLLTLTIGWRYGADHFDEAMLLVPALSYLAFISSQTGLNSHVRYVLPIAPFAFIWVSKLARSIEARHYLVVVPASAALAWSIAASLSVYPHSLSYFNELAGGPEQGHDHLLDSNIDWGQDLILLKEWIDEHPEARPMRIAYFGSYSPADVGIPFELPPMEPPLARDRNRPPAELGPQPGWYAISVNFLRGYRFFILDPQGERLWLSRPHLTYFHRLRPTARAGYSIYIYHLTLEDANRLRKEFGYPKLGEQVP